VVSRSCDANYVAIVIDLHEGTPSGSEGLRQVEGGNARIEPLAPPGPHDGLPLTGQPVIGPPAGQHLGDTLDAASSSRPMRAQWETC
jgi:hypothetical protein